MREQKKEEKIRRGMEFGDSILQECFQGDLKENRSRIGGGDRWEMEGATALTK